MNTAANTPSSDVRARLVAATSKATKVGSRAERESALRCLAPSELASLLHPQFSVEANSEAIGSGLPASPGAAAGLVALDADSAISMAERGLDVILVRSETTPDDVLGMQSARGVLTARGGLVSHAAVVARGWGIPAVVGVADLLIDEAGFTLGGRRFAAGDQISIDGGSGRVYEGLLEVASVEVPAELEELMNWADEVVGDRIAVRANADSGADARHARKLGAKGIGLCRTEHMFLAEDRLPLMRKFILTDDPAVEALCLADLQKVQRTDFVDILEAMDGLPVTVRLLDPPLHEFLPDMEPLVAAEARGEFGADNTGAGLGGAPDSRVVELAALRRLREANPMIGTRGVRLGVLKPGVYQMQVRALLEAVAVRVASGGKPLVEIMIPLVVEAREMLLARGWVTDAMHEVGLDTEAIAAVQVGVMIETPRAALTAGEIAKCADFFSFGTNDLTQLTFAFSRDDVETRLIPSYLNSGVLLANPFDRLDQLGVGRLIRIACADGRAEKPALKIGVCGEHAGDPNSVQFLMESGINYLSCSPYRVPVARLAAAHAVLGVSGTVGISSEDSPQNIGPGVSANPESGGREMSAEDARFCVLHALKIKGFGVETTISELSEVGVEQLRGELAELLQLGLVKHIPARSMWQLTPSGRELHASLIAGFVGERAAALHEPYPQFLHLNDRLKELCTRWQTHPDGSVNDHTDSQADSVHVANLASFHADTQPVLAGFAAGVDRFGQYFGRLTGALVRLQGGDPKAYTGVMCNSYHDIWMELHEDLIQLLGINRTAEGSF